MATFTNFLKLTLPALHEFTNSWNGPVNGNMEEIDDWLSDMYAGLVGTGSTSAWAALKGNLASLAARLNVSLDANGAISISGTPGILAMAVSAVKGNLSTPAARLDSTDFDIFDARQPFAGSRFVPVPSAGPSAAFPPAAGIDPGIAFRSADFGAKSGQGMSSPHVPWSPGLVMGGANPMISGLGIGQVRFTCDSPPAVFNIDGYVFRVREIIDLDYNLLSPVNNDWIWLYVDRNEGAYNSSAFRYTAPGGGGVVAKDLRILQAGTGTGTTSGNVFVATGSLFNTAPFGKIKEGDILSIITGADTGNYVISALDGVLPDTKLTIRGQFPTSGGSTSINWQILDKAHPNIGAVDTGATVTTTPPFVAGRVYIGRCQHQSGGNPINVVTFNAGGVFDSGWLSVDASADFPLTVTHNLGVFPSDVQVWCRTSGSATQIYQPIVHRLVLTDAGPVTATFLVPSLQVRSSELAVILSVLNASTTPSKPNALFTDSSNTDQTVGQVRVIARR
jgi:hypothetical protein